jgi:predicted GNAT family acetyltransferase
MKLGDGPIDQWREPRAAVLWIVSRLILFVFPVKDQWEVMIKEESDKLIFVGNQQVYGLGTIPMVAVVYKRTGKWLRVVCDDLNFKILGWKHIIQLFGAVPFEIENLSVLVQNGDPILMFPGGRKEFLKARLDQKYSIHFDQDIVDFVQKIAETNQYKVVPFCSVGASDMVVIALDIPVGCINMPLIIPRSYQRQYLSVGLTNGSFYQVSKHRKIALELQSSDKDRYLLVWCTKLVLRIAETCATTVSIFLQGNPKIKEI